MGSLRFLAPVVLLLASGCVGMIGDGDDANAGAQASGGGNSTSGAAGEAGAGAFGPGGSAAGGTGVGASEPGGSNPAGGSSQGGGGSGAWCGDGTCDANEDCTGCPDDCGDCTDCGDGACSGSEDCNSCPSDCGGVDIPSDFSGVQWLHTDVSGWAQTADLASVTFNNGLICLNHDKAGEWPGLDHVGAFVNGNPWIFIRHENKWYAATWEWMRHNQTCKNKSSVAGDHIKQNPFWNFQPRSGACYGFMVSGLARDSVRNVYERSQVRKIQWP